jgi:hypothetical protein
MTIHEPATLATDYLLAALAAILAWRLRRRLPPGNRPAHGWCYALGLTAAAAAVGGSSHGFGPNLPPGPAQALWVLTLLLLSMTSAAMSMSLIEEIAPPGQRAFWRLFVALKFAGFAIGELLHPVYLVAIVDYGTAMLAWLAAALILRRRWCAWTIAAIAFSLVAAVVQQSRWDISPAFNHNDLYHVIQAFALACFYLAALRLGPPVPAPRP